MVQNLVYEEKSLEIFCRFVIHRKKKIYMHYICKPTCVNLFLMFLCASLCRGAVLEYESSHLDYALRKYGDASSNTAPNA